MAYLIFYFYLFIGTVVPMNEINDGRELYYINTENDTVIEYAYKEEVLEYINTGTFEYNDFLNKN